MRGLFFFILLTALGGGGYYAWNNYPELKGLIDGKMASQQFHTLEIRYSAESIMEEHKKDLLKTTSHSFLEPTLNFVPYLLMEVKYAKDNLSTEEGHLLFSLNDGEMVIDGNNWEKTHGFEDCLIAKADKEDFKIIKAAIENGGGIDREKLYLKYKVDTALVDQWIESCRNKKLLVSNGNKLRLHFGNPKLSLIPVTKLDEAPVTYPAKNSQKVKRKYSTRDIEKFTMAIFGTDFAIKNAKEVFLPIYCIRVQNPDGSILTTSWNALTGKKTKEI